MLNKKICLYLFVLFCVFLLDLRDSHADSSEQVRFFNDFSAGFDTSLMFEENSIGKGFRQALVFGPEVALSVFNYKFSTAGLDLGYLFSPDHLRDGTAQFEVKTSYRYFKSSGFYHFKWRFLIAGANIGVFFSIATREAILREVSTVINGDHVNFIEGNVLDSEKMTGVTVGFLTGLRAGIDIASWIHPCSSTKTFELSILAIGNYMRTGAADAFSAGGAIAFWPGGLF